MSISTDILYDLVEEGDETDQGLLNFSGKGVLFKAVDGNNAKNLVALDQRNREK